MAEKIVMDCGVLKTTDRESPNINVAGAIRKVYEARTFAGRQTQFFVLGDPTGDIGVKISEAPFKDSHIGCQVEINNAIWTSYFDKVKKKQNWILDATKAEVKYEHPDRVERPQPAHKTDLVEFEKKQEEQMERCMKLATMILLNQALADDLALAKKMGWTSEDLRTLAVSFFIEINRNKAFIK